MTVIKALNMLLKKERKGERPKFPKEEEVRALTTMTVWNRKTCKTCGQMHGPVCYTERPDLAPEWYQGMTRGTKRKRTEEAHTGIAFSF